MEVTFLGHSCIRLRGREADVLVDPPPDRRGRLDPDIVVLTEGEVDPERLREGRPQTVSGPGEYELRGVRITGVRDGRVTVMSIDVDEVRVVAVGRLDHQLGEEAVDRLGHVDVLTVPVGGGDALSATEATRLVNLVEPGIVIPVRYRVDVLSGDYEPVDRFAKEMGLAEGWTAQPRLTLSGGGGGEETRVVVLEPRV